MKYVVVTDNFGRSGETPGCDEKRACVYQLPAQEADELCKLLNKLYSGPQSPDWFKVVEADYELQRFVP